MPEKTVKTSKVSPKPTARKSAFKTTARTVAKTHPASRTVGRPTGHQAGHSAAPAKEISLPKIEIKDQATMAELLGAAAEKEFELGQTVSGVVAAITRDKIVVDLEGKAAGAIIGQEIYDSSRAAEGLKVGDKVDAMLIGSEDEEGNYRLSLRAASQQRTWQNFVDANANDTTIEVRIIEANKGGLLIDVDGIRGFIPVSQLSPEHYPRVNGADAAKILSKLQALVGQRLTVKVLTVNKTEGRLILSERAAQQEERMKIIKKLKVGQTLTGRVSGIVNFGIFVNYNGVEGLVHISEITWGHVDDPGKYAKVGQDLTVMVIGIDGEKVSFSMKRLTPDPWADVVTRYKAGDVVKGPVRRVTPFGIFVKLGEEIDGLIHISELSSEHVESPDQLFKVGDQVEAKVINIDSEERRLGLSIKALTVPVEETAEEADKETGKGETKGAEKAETKVVKSTAKKASKKKATAKAKAKTKPTSKAKKTAKK